MCGSSAVVLGLLLALSSTAEDGTASLVGVLQDFTGARIAGAGAELRSSTGRVFRARSDDSGTYLFSTLPADEYTLKLSSPGFSFLTVKSIHILDGAQQVLPPLTLSISICGETHAILDYLRMQPAEVHGGTLRGRVDLDLGPNRKGRTAPPIPDAHVALICGKGTICGATKTGSNGQFLFSEVVPNTLRVRITKPGFYPLEETGFEAKEGF